MEKSLTIFQGICYLVAIFFFFSLCIKLGKERRQMYKNIGKSVIIYKDTLLITDISIIGYNYWFNNGSRAEKEFVEKQLKK